jgi:hypothetical protein
LGALDSAQSPTVSELSGEPGALSPTLASIARLPTLPVFLSTAQVLGAAPTANKRRIAAQVDAPAQTAAPVVETAPVAAKSAARKKPAAADKPQVPLVSVRKRKAAEPIVVPAAASSSRRKASTVSARP